MAKLASCMTPLMIRQHWFRQWLGAVRQQAVTPANADPDLYRHMGSLGQNGLIQPKEKKSKQTHVHILYVT